MLLVELLLELLDLDLVEFVGALLRTLEVLDVAQRLHLVLVLDAVDLQLLELLELLELVVQARDLREKLIHLQLVLLVTEV